MSPEATDWDSYYRRTPRYTSLTRAISANKLCRVLGAYSLQSPSLSVCEIGGANSCFVETLTNRLNIGRYHVVDLNELGLSLLSGKKVTTPLTYELADVLTEYSGTEQFDLVYSVGLVEHFQTQGTRQAIKSHFDRCRPGGLVLITFPTPTLPYNVIRGVAEKLNVWKFPDERPLHFDEVVAGCQPFGTVIHQSINWAIGLTQGYVVARKS